MSYIFELIKIIKDKYKFYTIKTLIALITLIAIIICTIINYLRNFDEINKYLNIYIELSAYLFSALIIFIAWLYKRKLPKFNKNHIGDVFNN